MRFNTLPWNLLSGFVRKYVANVEDDWTLAPRSRTHESTSTVYCLVNLETNKIWYIGHTKNLLRRIMQHENNPRIAKADWDTVAYLTPGITSSHIRLQVEGILQIAAVPQLCQWVSLRRLKNDQWKEIKSFANNTRRAGAKRIIIGKTSQ